MAESERPSSFCYRLQRSLSTSTLSITSSLTDEGYCSDEKQSFSSFATDEPEGEQYEEQHKRRYSDYTVPILKSTRTIRMSYSVSTYALTLSIIALSLYILITHPRPWTHTFPPFFVAFHLMFHVTHLFAHLFQMLDLERHCVVYGTFLYWTGCLLGNFVFSERLTIMNLTHPTTTLFWLLLLERRNAWGIIMWEFSGRLDSATGGDRYWQKGSFRTAAYRVWCLLGAGSAWGLLYIALANMDGFTLGYLLRPISVAKLLLVSTMAGISMICFWSFWTFQYRGVLWKRELRKGVVVWYSEGVARAGDVE